jgi:hypothetical protein
MGGRKASLSREEGYYAGEDKKMENSISHHFVHAICITLCYYSCEYGEDAADRKVRECTFWDAPSTDEMVDGELSSSHLRKRMKLQSNWQDKGGIKPLVIYCHTMAHQQ